MAATIDPSVRIDKSFTYRGQTRVFSNRYFFDNLKPADNTKWTTFCDAVVNAEKACYISGGQVSIIGATGYDAGSDVPVFTKTYATGGTGVFSGWNQVPGDVAALVRYSTAQKTLKNHPIYLFNYVKGVGNSTTGAVADALNPAQRSALQTYAGAWVSGFSDGAVTHHRCGPQGHVATGFTVDANLRHRDFPAG